MIQVITRVNISTVLSIPCCSHNMPVTCHSYRSILPRVLGFGIISTKVTTPNLRNLGLKKTGFSKVKEYILT